MDKNLEKIKEIRKVESIINRNLFIVCAIVTLAAMILVTVNFFAKGSFYPTKINFFYLAVVLIYSAHKELVRWLGEKRGHRHGEYFVFIWVILTTILYVVNFFSNEYFSYSKEGYELSTLADVSYITLQILGVFVVTRIIKVLFIFKK
jgi:hypothetical protein